MFLKLLPIILLCSFLSANQSNVTHFLLPYENKSALNSILSSINSAENSIYLMIFSFTYRDISRALKDAARKGVEVKVIADLRQSQGDFSQIAYLNKYNNITLYTLEGKPHQRGHKGSMHTKIMIIDDKLTYTGSANFSQSAFTIHYENIILFSDSETATLYKDFFYKIKEEATTF